LKVVAATPDGACASVTRNEVAGVLMVRDAAVAAPLTANIASGVKRANNNFDIDFMMFTLRDVNKKRDLNLSFGALAQDNHSSSSRG
jgi:hypothetical protein